MLIHPTIYATQRQITQGEFPLATFDRLAAVCQQKLTGAVQYELVGEIDWLGTPYLQLKVSANIPQVCQRCLKTYVVAAVNEVNLSPVFSEGDIEKLPPEYEPLLLTADELDLAALVEDELLLILSSTPKHNLKDCSVKETSWNFGESQPEQGKENPFAQLKKLKEE